MKLLGQYVSKACEYTSQFFCRACFNIFGRWPALNGNMIEFSELVSSLYYELSIMKIHVHCGINISM
jgi:hypothetical protein